MTDILLTLLLIFQIILTAAAIWYSFKKGYEIGREEAKKECDKKIEETKELYK